MMAAIRQKFVKRLFNTNVDASLISSYLFETNIFMQVSDLAKKLEECKTGLRTFNRIAARTADVGGKVITMSKEYYSKTSINEHLYIMNTSCLNACLGPPRSIFAVNRPLHSEHLLSLNTEHYLWSGQYRKPLYNERLLLDRGQNFRFYSHLWHANWLNFRPQSRRYVMNIRATKYTSA